MISEQSVTKKLDQYKMELKKLAVISDGFKEFIQSGNYEVSILKLMNQSRIIFPNTYIRNEIQSSSGVILLIR